MSPLSRSAAATSRAPGVATAGGATPRGSRRWRRRLRTTVRGLTIAVVLVVVLLPIAWMMLASFKTGLDISDPSKMFSFTPTLKNFQNVFGEQDFFQFMVNSFVVAAASTLLSLVLGLPAAYGISRYNVNSANGFVLMARVIPAISLLVPWYYLFAQLSMVGSYASLVLSHMFVSLPLIIAIMTGFFDGMPLELEESARIDGLSRWGAFLRVTLPLSAPGVATSSILAFIFSWNNFMFALVLSGEGTKTLPVAIFNFIAYTSIDWGGLMAASVTITTPVIVIALFLQKYIVSGLTAGATKG